MYSPPDPGEIQRPSSGCEACGGPVRTYKQGIDWFCWKCAPRERRITGR